MRKVNEMKRISIICFCLIATLYIIFICGCSHTEEIKNPLSVDESHFVVEPSAYLEFEQSIEKCVENADLIVIGTVSSIGESYLADGYMIDSGMNEYQIKEAVKRTTTPINISVNEVLKPPKNNKSEFETETELIVLENYGVVNNKYELLPIDGLIPLKDDLEYILFLKEINGAYYILHQPSVVVYPNGTYESLLGNDLLYSTCESCGDIIHSIQLYVE